VNRLLRQLPLPLGSAAQMELCCWGLLTLLPWKEGAVWLRLCLAPFEDAWRVTEALRPNWRCIMSAGELG